MSPVSDKAILRAVNLAAIVHNLLWRYDKAIRTGDWEDFYAKMYQLSQEYEQHRDAYEEMRLEWVRRSRIRDTDA